MEKTTLAAKFDLATMKPGDEVVERSGFGNPPDIAKVLRVSKRGRGRIDTKLGSYRATSGACIQAHRGLPGGRIEPVTPELRAAIEQAQRVRRLCDTPWGRVPDAVRALVDRLLDGGEQAADDVHRALQLALDVLADHGDARDTGLAERLGRLLGNGGRS